MEAALFAVTAVLALGLLSDRWNGVAAVVACVWSIGAAAVLAVDGRWGWVVFYAACGLGGLALLLFARTRLRTQTVETT